MLFPQKLPGTPSSERGPGGKHRSAYMDKGAGGQGNPIIEYRHVRRCYKLAYEVAQLATAPFGKCLELALPPVLSSRLFLYFILSVVTRKGQGRACLLANALEALGEACSGRGCMSTRHTSARYALQRLDDEDTTIEHRSAQIQ